mgnify:FL=1
MFSSVPAEILGLVAGWGFLLIVAAFCFPIRSSYQKPIGKGKIVTAAAVSSIVLVLGIGALSNLFLSWEKAGPSFLLWLTGIAVLEIGLLLAFTYRKTRRWRKQNPLYAVVKMEYRYGLWKERGVMLLSINRVPVQHSNDAVVGKAGIEQYMELELQGKDGEETVTVDNLGKVLDIDNSKTVDPVAGNDVYLTIDSDWQKSIYQILEQRVAGIVL